MNYASIRIEGSIFSPDILDRLEDAAGQKPADFGLDGAIKVKDEIARAWADAQDYWRIFHRKLDTLRSDSPATTETRNLWVVPLLGLLGYQLEYQARGTEINAKNYPISHRVTNRAGTALHIAGYREPAGLDRKPERAALRMSAHAMVQEYLNLSDEIYGLVTNGRVLRLLRDSSRLIKLTYLEFDLDRIFTDGLFADFAILYRLLHSSRLPANKEAAAESLLERYHQDSLDSGARIRDGLSKAVEKAIRDFGNGFLAHPGNDALRVEIAAKKLTPELYYQQLLRLIYRLLFLMVIEERGLVYPSSAKRAYRDIYESYYSIQRLRRLSEKRHLADRRRHDLWLSLLATFQLFEAHGPGLKLGLAPLAGDLFSPEAIGSLGQASLGNDVLLGCLRSLGLYQNPDTRQLIRVNYAALNVEEFGSVYEGLLEYRPVFEQMGERIEFTFAEGDERARTGSHYTPDDLVQPLIKHSLDYLIADKLKAPEPAKGLLDLRVADITCGSGHILLAAARRIATELAIVRTGEEQPSPEAFRTAIRDVIKECIYGVDLNPLAVELCKVALWLEAHNPGEPLNFLDHHIKCGNAIVGFARRGDVERGVPDEAFAALPSDDKETAILLRKRNKQERKDHAAGQLPLAPALQKQLDDILHGWRELAAMPEKRPDEIDAKKKRYLAFTQSADAWVLGQIAAIPIAQFFLPKAADNLQKFITDETFRRYWKGEMGPQGQATAEAWALGSRERFFHWFLEFPEIMERGGFDCILGNPPYLGGQDLSGTYGHPFCQYVKWQFEPAGLSDLVVFFVRRIFSLLRMGGNTAFLTTNSIKDGDIRKDGLEQVLSGGGEIIFAIRSAKWSGRAKLSVSSLSIHKGQWQGARWLDGRAVTWINGHIEDELPAQEPNKLIENAKQMFNGSNVFGDGFYLSPEEAQALIAQDRSYLDVIFPVLNGMELNNQAELAPDRFIINFGQRSYEDASAYPLALALVEEKVRPEREKIPRDTPINKHYHDDWWLFGVLIASLYKNLSRLSHCFVFAATTKHFGPVSAPTSFVYTHAARVLTTDRWDIFGVVQSSLHEAWARKFSGEHETRLRYSPTQCFNTFAFPDGLWNTPQPDLAATGERYHEHRRTLMRELQVGITDIYNLFHARDLSPAMVAKVGKGRQTASGYGDLAELRRLHVQLDIAVRDAYGWSDLNLGHDFYEVGTLPENDRIRYTISPEARKEILRRLLALNSERASIEATIDDSLIKKKGRTKGKARDVVADLPDSGMMIKGLEINPKHLPDRAWEIPATIQATAETATLVAVLKAFGKPTLAREVRLTALLAMNPRLLSASLAVEERALWQRLIGAEAVPLPTGISQMQPPADHAWGGAVTKLRGTGRLIENLAAQTWAPGVGIDAIVTEGWPDGRVGMVLSVLQRRGAEEIVQALPQPIREWIDAKAA